MQVHVCDGDISKFHVDALITAINSGQMWYGGIDAVITRSAGGQFHAQAAAALNEDPSAKVIIAERKLTCDANFKNVVFTVDDLDEDLDIVVGRALDAALAAGYQSVSIPAIRLGVMKDLAGTQSEKVQAIVKAIRDHEAKYAQPLHQVSIVIYDDASLSREFSETLQA